MQGGLQAEGTPIVEYEQSPARVICRVCPHGCDLGEGEHGKCLVRCNDHGSLTNPFEGRCSLLSVEPVEKRPFFHYKPGSKYLAVGFYGCPLFCSHCQNFKVSQSVDGDSIYKTPSDLVNLAKKKETAGIAFTFNEPAVYYEYIIEVGELGADVIIKTSGFVNLPIVDKLVETVSAWNVDIKGDEFEYSRTCKGSLKPVLNTIERLAGRTHLEISYLISPRMVADMAFHARIRDWLTSLDAEIPVHLLHFYPFHKVSGPGYQPEALEPVIGLFKEKMPYTYVSNAFGSQIVGYRNTVCGECGRVLIERLRGVRVVTTKCCGKEVRIVGV